MVFALGLNTRAPYQLLTFSIAFGATSFHSFVVSPVAFNVLPREEFGKLQHKIFPLYFIGQTIAPAILGLTSPLKLCPFTLSLLSLSGLAGAVNYFVFLPLCQRVKEQRKQLTSEKLHEMVVDGEVKPSDKMKELNKQFGTYHGLSTIFNIVSIFSVGVYGLVLSRRLL